MTKFTPEQLALLEEKIEFTEDGFNIIGDLPGSVGGDVGGGAGIGGVGGSVGGTVWGGIGDVIRPRMGERGKSQ